MVQGPGATLPSAGTADQVAVRRHNLAVVASHLRRHGARSRARVAAETGLNKATVSSLVAELVTRGLVVEGAVERGAVGRPGRVVEIDTSSFAALGAEVNIDYVSVLAMDLDGGVVEERRVPMDTAAMAPGRVQQRLADTAAETIDGLLARGTRPIGLTLAVPGLSDESTGRVQNAPNLGWRDQPIVEAVRRRLGDPDFPIHLDNEANLAALAELESRGPTSTVQHLLLLTGAVGVGGGVVCGGQLLRGVRGFAGELGHMQVDRLGDPCPCGRRGCWETVVGLKALLRLAADATDEVRDPAIDLERRLDVVRRRAVAGDARTLEAIDEVGEWLVSGCGNLVNVFNPEVLVLGGYFAVLGEWFVPQLREGLREHVFAPEAGGVAIELSTLGFSAAIRGGALRAAEAVFDDPTLAPVRLPTEVLEDVPVDVHPTTRHTTGATR